MAHNFTYLSEYDSGRFGEQRGSFILYNGVPKDIQIYQPTDGDDFFHWVNRKNLTIMQSEYKFDTLSRSDIIINAVEANFEINFLNGQLPVE